MEATPGVWADVDDGMYIRDLNNKTWRVTRSTETRVRLIDRDRKVVDLLRPPGEREVTIMAPTDEEARYTLQKALGARVLASRVDGEYFCPPPMTWDLYAAQWHMSRFHRIDVGEMSLNDIRDLHETSDPTCEHHHTEDV